MGLTKLASPIICYGVCYKVIKDLFGLTVW